jgi:hypothetical protein
MTNECSKNPGSCTEQTRSEELEWRIAKAIGRLTKFIKGMAEGTIDGWSRSAQAKQRLR